MKRFYLILAAIAALATTAQATEWDSFELGDWNNPTTYNGSYFDMAPTNFYLAHTGVQMIFTPEMLADMQNKEEVRLTQMTFMFHCETFEDICRDVVIFVQPIDATEFAVNEQGIKQFFPIEGEPAVVEQRELDLSYLYGEDVELSFRFNVPYTPGKGLLVTMAFDAQDDDNCTMGSDYAPFYTSGIRGKAMTYTNNWTSFYEYTQGSDFPNATASLGCGTNVDLPLVKIGYSYEYTYVPPVIPANPTADSWYDCGDESGYSRFYFTLPTTDVNGTPLDKENLSYAVWINDGNGEVYQFTFPAEVYFYDLYEDINEVPYYLYSTGYDFYEDHVYLYRTNEPGYEPLFVRDESHDGNIGIQVFYTTDRAKTQSEIVWLYEETPPTPPTPTEKTGAPVFNGYTTDGIHAYFVEIVPSEPSTIYYRVQYGQNGEFTEWAEYEDILDFTQDGWYRVEAYAVAPGKLESDHIAYEFVVNPATGLSEMVGSKTAISTRYFNAAGQEMQEANGLTIVVTTYTDGTTSTVKVMK